MQKSEETKSVLVFGAGIAGLTAAQELAERGIKVTVIEKEKEPGGKAKSFMLPGKMNAEHAYPGEHGFRFFLRWYENLHDTLKRIPVENNSSVFKNLAGVDELLIDEYIFSFVKAEPVPVRPPLAWIKALTACKQRHEEEFELTTWEKFIDDNLKDEEPHVITFFKNTPKATASVHSEDASVRALSYTLNRLLMNPGLDVLNGPTNTSWFDYWVKYLQSLGVEFCFETTLMGFNTGSHSMLSAQVLQQGNTHLYSADYYISAIPHKKLERAFTLSQLYQFNLEHIIAMESGWQAGIVLYLKEPIQMPRGHFGFSCSTWAISGIQQTDFWNHHNKEQFTSSNYKAILSLIIADWDAVGEYCGKPAKECLLEEMIEELKFQLKKYAPPPYCNSFEKMDIVDYSIDPGIHLTGTKDATNDTPLFMNTAGSWRARPGSETAISNFFIAGDFTKTSAYLATMESANESGRRAANSVLTSAGKPDNLCKIYTEKHNKVSKLLTPLIKIDEILYAQDKKHVLDYFTDAQASQFINNLMPYMQFEGGMINAADGLYDNMLLLWTVVNEQQTGISLDLLELVFATGKKTFNHLADQVYKRAAGWAKVNMLAADGMPRQFTESLHSYIDTGNPIFGPLLHVTKQKGSMHRVQYAYALNEWYNVDGPAVSHLLETGQCIHNCSLLIDDIMDNTKLRRNTKTAHEIFGINQTLCAAYTTFFQVLISTYINLGEKCLVYYIEESSRAHMGQSDDVYYRETRLCPPEEKYMDIIANKTGSFFRVFALCLSALTDNKIDSETNGLILKLADTIGLFFQVRDDYMDLTSEEYFRKKGTFASDFEEGKYSFPVVYCLDHYPEYEETFRTTLGEGISESSKHNLLKLLDITGSLGHTLLKTKMLYEEAIGLIDSIDARLSKTNRKLREWLLQMAEQTPGFDMTVLSSNNAGIRKPAPAVNDPFDVSVLQYETLARAIRNVICCYAVYFKLNNRSEEQFWKCFPLLVTVECMILNLDNQNETKDRNAAILTDETISRSKTWQLISKSSFYSPEMDSIMEYAKEYYQAEHEWYKNKSSLCAFNAVRFMNHHKSTNFRILYLLSSNVLDEAAFAETFFNLEDYASVLIEEKEAVEDNHAQVYNVLLHAKSLPGGIGLEFLDAYKKELEAVLDEVQKAAVQEWLNIYFKAGKYIENPGYTALNAGLKKIYNTAKHIADTSRTDDELSAFTLAGNFKWCIQYFFNEQSPFKTTDAILRRLQNDALLSVSQ